MDQFIPVAWIKVGPLSGVVGPAYFADVRKDEGSLIVTGGDDPQAVFLTGDRIGKGFRAQVTSGRHGFAVDGISIEVDANSMFSPERDGYREGAVGLLGDDVYILASNKAQFSFEDTFCWNLSTGAGREYISGLLGFSKWRIRKAFGDEMKTIADVSAPEIRR